jgi:PTS hybrid protein
MTVGLVIVSHSAKIAEGVVELATQMAGGVVLVAAGGTDDGGIGTSYDRVMAAVGEADDGDGVIVLCDLGSAILTTETALDFLDDDLRERVRVANAPIVEGAVAAAVAAEIGGDLDTVLGAAELAAGPAPAGATGPATSDAATQEVSAEPAPDTVAAEAKLINPSGLHALQNLCGSRARSTPRSRSTGSTRRACSASWRSVSVSARSSASRRRVRRRNRRWMLSRNCSGRDSASSAIHRAASGKSVGVRTLEVRPIVLPERPRRILPSTLLISPRR